MKVMITAEANLDLTPQKPGTTKLFLSASWGRGVVGRSEEGDEIRKACLYTVGKLMLSSLLIKTGV